MLEIIKGFVAILIFLVAILSLIIIMMQIRMDNINTTFTFAEKLKRSLIAGFMLSILLLSLFAAILVPGWNYSFMETDFSTILIAIACLVIPAQILGTVGLFMRLTYINFLWSKSTKK